MHASTSLAQVKLISQERKDRYPGGVAVRFLRSKVKCLDVGFQTKENKDVIGDQISQETSTRRCRRTWSRCAPTGARIARSFASRPPFLTTWSSGTTSTACGTRLSGGAARRWFLIERTYAELRSLRCAYCICGLLFLTRIRAYGIALTLLMRGRLGISRSLCLRMPSGCSFFHTITDVTSIIVYNRILIISLRCSEAF